MFKKNTIKGRVMEIINDRIDAVQEAHDEEIAYLEDTHVQEIQKIKDAHQINKVLVTEKHINSILNKIL